jgi:hypothetical protein
MNSTGKLDGDQFHFPGRRETKMKSQRRTLACKWREMFRRRRRMHDPMLVLNMSMFNFADGWNRTFNQLKIHENGA